MTNIVYFNGAYLREDEVCVAPDDRGWLLGDGVYEVTPLYTGRAFRLGRHLDRFARSMEAARIAHDAHDWGAVAHQLASRNALHGIEKSIIYMQVTRGAARRTHAFPSPPVRPTGYAYAALFPPKFDPDAGCAVITVSDVRWSRCDIKTISLMANCMANQEAREAGAYEAVFVRDGMVLEGTHTNVFAVIGGAVCTAPLTNYVLPGVTRETVLEICRAEGIPACERPVTEREFHNADEVFLTGTTTEVLGVASVDGRAVGGGGVGPVTRRLRELYLARATATVSPPEALPT